MLRQLGCWVLVVAGLVPASAAEPIVRQLAGPEAGTSIACSLYAPDPLPKEMAGLVVHLYGSGGSHKDFNAGTPSYAEFRQLLSERGYWLAVPELGPRHWMNDQAVKQVDAVIADLVREERVDPKRIHLLGASMGAGSSLVYVMRRPGKIRSVVAVFPMTDFAQWLEEVPKYRPAIEQAHGITAEDRTARLHDLSPLHHTDAFAKTPVFLLHGDKDVTVLPHHSRDFAAALKEQKSQVVYQEVAGEVHRDEIAQKYQRDMADFLTKTEP